MKIFFLAALLLISACTTKPVEVIYTSTWREQWQNEILEKCSSESHLLTLRIYESKIAAGYELTQVDVVQLQKMLMQGCLVYFNVVI
jgi:hypothetical protein